MIRPLGICFSLSLLSGCAQPVNVPPLQADHPGNPTAAEAPRLDRVNVFASTAPATSPSSRKE